MTTERTRENEQDILKKIVVVGAAASSEMEWECEQQFLANEGHMIDYSNTPAYRTGYLQALMDFRTFIVGVDTLGESNGAVIETIIERGKGRYNKARETCQKYSVLG